MKGKITALVKRTMRFYYYLFFMFCFALPSLASTPGLFDEALRFLNSFQVPKVEKLEPSVLKDRRNDLQNNISLFESRSREYEEKDFNKLSEEEKKIIKAIVDLFPAFGEIIRNRYSPNSFVKMVFFEFAREALGKMFNTLIEKIGGESEIWYDNFKYASNSMSSLGNSITVLLKPQFEVLCDLLKDAGDKGQAVVDKVQEVIDGVEECDVVLKWVSANFKNRQDILDQVSTIEKEYSKKFYIRGLRDYAKKLGPVKEMLKNEDVSRDINFWLFSSYFMRFFLYKHLASQSEENLVDLLFVQGNPAIKRFWEQSKLIFESDENLKHESLVRYFEQKRDNCRDELFKRYPMGNLLVKYPDITSAVERSVKNTFFPQSTQEQVTSEVGSKAKNTKAKTEEIASETGESKVTPLPETVSSEISRVAESTEAKATTPETLISPEQKMKSKEVKASIPPRIQPSESKTSSSETKTPPLSNLQGTEKRDTSGTGIFGGNEKLIAIIFSAVIILIIGCIAGFVIYNRRTKSASIAS